MCERTDLRRILACGDAFFVEAHPYGISIQDDLGERIVHFPGGMQVTDLEFFGSCVNKEPLDRNSLVQAILESLLMRRGHSAFWANRAVHRKDEQLQPPETQLDKKEVSPGLYMVWGHIADAIATWVEQVGFDSAVKELETIISDCKLAEAEQKQRANRERPEDGVNPNGNWVVVKTATVKYVLTRTARKLFKAMFRLSKEGMDLEPGIIFAEAGFELGSEPDDRRLDRIFRRCKAYAPDGQQLPGSAWAKDNTRLVGSVRGRKGFYQINIS